MDQNKIDIRDLPLEKCVPNSWNPNHMDDASFNRLTEELSEVGFIDPIQVVALDDGTFRILGGEHRWHAARVLGWETIPAVVLSEDKWRDEDLQKLVTVRLNMLRGKINPEKMASLYSEMADKYGEESLQQLFAWTDKDAWGKLVKSVSKGLRSSLPKEIADKFDETAKEIRTVDDLSMILNNLFTKYGNTLKYNFMVFTWGGKEHMYIAMDKDMKKAMDRLMEYCKESERDINQVMAPITQRYLDFVERQFDDELPSQTDDEVEDVPVT